MASEGNTFGIKDPNLAVEQGSQMMSKGQYLENCRETLSGITARTKAAWQSQTTDAISFIDKLNKDLDNLAILASAIYEYGNGLSSTAEKAIQISNN